jgi:hypothetical protein
MPDDYLRAIERLIAIVVGCLHWNSAQAHESATVKKGQSASSDDKTDRRLQCATSPKVLALAEPRAAQFVMASLVASGTAGGAPRFVRRSASIV